MPECGNYEDRGQKTEDRGQKSEDRGQKTEDRRQNPKNKEEMKMNKKINRRRFLKEGIFLGCMAALFPLLKMGREEKPHPLPHPRKARHWKKLAG